jgi:hypothetical protein
VARDAAAAMSKYLIVATKQRFSSALKTKLGKSSGRREPRRRFGGVEP